MQLERTKLIIRTAFVSTYPPRRCGIALFAEVVADAADTADGDNLISVGARQRGAKHELVAAVG